MDTITQTDRLVLGRDRDDSRPSWRRRQIVSAAALPRPALALEIGSFDNPTLGTRDGLDVRHVDPFSRIVDVGYVVSGPRLSPFIAAKVDFLVATT